MLITLPALPVIAVVARTVQVRVHSISNNHTLLQEQSINLIISIKKLKKWHHKKHEKRNASQNTL